MKMKRLLAMLLTVLMGISPLAVLAEPGFSAGEIFPVLLKDNYAQGKEIYTRATFDVFLGEGQNALSEGLSQNVLEIGVYDDFGVTCISLNLLHGETSLANAFLTVSPQKEYTLVTSLLPGQKLVMTQADLSRLLGGENGVDMEKIRTLIEGQWEETYITYFYRMAGWVSDTQRWNDDMYVSIDEPQEATDTCDAVSQAMKYRVQTIDLLYLLENVTFYFRDNDHKLQEVVTEILREMNVKRGDFRRVVDGLFVREDLNGPEHWVKRTDYWTPEELEDIVSLDDVYYLATKMAYSVKTLQSEMIDNATEYTFYEGEDYSIVGFDGTMPQMWADFPFENGSFVYGKKTLEGEGVRHSAQGHMDLLKSGYAVDGTLSLNFAQRAPQGYTDTYALQMDWVKTDDENGIEAQVENAKFLENGADVNTLRAQIKLTDDEESVMIEAYMKSSTQEVEEDFENETNMSIAVGEQLSVGMQLQMQSREYEEPVPGELTQVDVSNLSADEASALGGKLMTAAFQLVFLALSK